MTTLNVLTDIHAGAAEGQVFDKLAETAERQSLDGPLFVLGDLIQDSEDTDQNVYRLDRVMDILRRNLDVEVYAIGGNHDANTFTREGFEQLVGNRHNTIVEYDGWDILLVDSAFGLGVDNAGYLGPRSIEFIRENAHEKAVVLSHFPLIYMGSYVNSPFFNFYPEGVFAIDKYEIEHPVREGELDFGGFIFGHLHEYVNYYAHGNECTIVDPFYNFVEEEADGFIRGIKLGGRE